MRNSMILPLAALAMLAACDSGQPDETAPVVETTTPATVPPAPGIPPMTSPVGTGTPDGFETMDIPAAMQGRWGMGAADCEPGRDDAKGLLVIGPRRLEFYESVGTLDELEEMVPNRIRGDFDFTGEGMSWDRDVVLELQDGGDTLLRSEFGDDAAPGPFRYSKCA